MWKSVPVNAKNFDHISHYYANITIFRPNCRQSDWPGQICNVFGTKQIRSPHTLERFSPIHLWANKIDGDHSVGGLRVPHSRWMDVRRGVGARASTSRTSASQRSSLVFRIQVFQIQTRLAYTLVILTNLQIQTLHTANRMRGNASHPDELSAT